jgi:hypothetical protein
LLRLSRILNFIKALIDQGIDIPDPLPFNEASHKSFANKIEIGSMLLQWFLHDGKIRGIKSGHIYSHTVNTELTHRFIRGLEGIDVRGCK